MEGKERMIDRNKDCQRRNKLSNSFLPAALDLIHSGWLHYSYYSASVRIFRGSAAEAL